MSRIAKAIGPKFELVQSLVNTPYLKSRNVPTRFGNLKFSIAKWIDISTARISKIHFHGISNTVLEHYQPLFGFRKKDTHLIYRGRQGNRFVSEPRKLSSSESLILLNVGRQDAQKDQVTAIKALGILKTKYGITNVLLKSYGRPGSESGAIHAAIEAYDVQEQVIFPGFTNDIEKEYSVADAFVFPSLFEGLGGALVEAMAARLPILCTEIPILTEVVGDTDGALFFPPGGAEMLATHIRRLMEDPLLYERLSGYSFRRFENMFTQEDSLCKTIEMYRAVLAG